jgi:Tfp pilus assembly protein PilE
MVVVAIVHEDLKYMFNRHSRGIGLLELMLSIGIIALVIIMATRYFSVVREQQKISQTMTMVTTLLQAGRTYVTGVHPTCTATLNSLLAEAGLIPKDYGEGKPGPWGSVTITASASGDLCQNFEIKLGGVPAGMRTTMCQMLTTNIMGNQTEGSGKVNHVWVDAVCP